jgi:hypothetical protein
LAISSKPSPRKKLSPTEITDPRLKGLCFRYDDKFSLGHNAECKHLFVIEVLENDETTSEEVAVGDPTISIHAVTNIQPSSRNTMQIRVDIGDTWLIALLDSVSTHNFIDTPAIERDGISLCDGEILCVVVANGDLIKSLG